MREVEFFRWQFKTIEPGKRVPRRLNYHMDVATARARFGDAIEPQPGTREVRQLPETPQELMQAGMIGAPPTFPPKGNT